MWFAIGAGLALVLVIVVAVYTVRRNRREEKIWGE
jgi:hypothetical protein